MEKDPVCGMTVDPKRSAGSSVYGGKTYYFCSASCKATFDRSPAHYVKIRTANFAAKVYSRTGVSSTVTSEFWSRLTCSKTVFGLLVINVSCTVSLIISRYLL